jgi:predicted Zn-dependent protease
MVLRRQFMASAQGGAGAAALQARAGERGMSGGGVRGAKGGSGNRGALLWSIMSSSPTACPMRLLRGLTVLTVAGLSALAGARGQELKLPDIGSSAAAIMSPQDLHDYGASMLQQLRAYNLVLDDALLSDYLNALGYRLVAASDRPDTGFTFFIVRDDEINAFAAPGGFIGVNAGLLTAMPSEDALAGVIAHEISHVQQQHILRAFEDQKKMSVPIMLGMLGVMIAASGRTDDAAPAALIAGSSLMQQRQINFTRSEEAEADRVGIQTLARAGFEPAAMADAFGTFQKVMRANGVDVPEFLRSHPLDSKRIAEAKARAMQLQAQAADVRAKRSDGIDLARLGPGLLPNLKGADAPRKDAALNRGEAYFELMRARARVLAARSATSVRAYYADNLRDDPAFDTPANRYGYALALIATREPARAADELRKLAAQQPESPVLRLALAQAQDQAGAKAEALKLYEQLNTDFPGNRAITLTYVDALLGHADAAGAKRSQDLLRPLVERYADDPELQRSYGRANELAGDKVRAAEAYAEATWLNGHAEDALNQLKALAKQADLTYYQRSRIEARITQLTPAVLELRKRNAPAPSDSLAPLR